MSLEPRAPGTVGLRNLVVAGRAALFVMVAGCGTADGGRGTTSTPSGSTRADWSAVAAALGREGAVLPDGVFRVDVPRTSPALHNEYGFAVPPSMTLTYAAFAGSPAEATVVGDTCMVGGEVNPVIDALRAGDVEIVALHNHMLGGEPGFFFLHFQGRGPAVALARTVRAAWDRMNVEHPKPPRPRSAPPRPDWTSVAAAFGREGRLQDDGMYKITMSRSDVRATLDGRPLPAGVGLACWAGFAPCDCGATMVMGDTCVLRSELQAAIDGYRAARLRIVAIHNHGYGASPELMFCHFEGEGDATQLARAVASVWARLG